MKRAILFIIAFALVLGSASMTFAQEAKPIINYKTTTLKMNDPMNQVEGIKAKLTIPNYIGSVDVTLETLQGKADATVHVVYLPKEMWDGPCYYSAVQAKFLPYGLRLFTGSTDIVGWKDLYSYGFLPVDGGTAIFSPDSAELHFLQGPGLYSALISLPYSETDTGFTNYADALLNAESKLLYTAVGMPFMLVLDDDSIAYFLENGTLDQAASFAWPGLKDLLLSVQKITEPVDEAAGLNNFKDKNLYVRGMFLDMPYDFTPWYEVSVESVVRIGLMQGYSSGKFLPEGDVQLSEVIAMASRLHHIYNGGNGDFIQGPTWYNTYIRYALANGIIKEGDFANFERPATRGEMAYIFASAVPPAALNQINVVTNIRDVNAATAYDEEIFLLYRAGVVTGYADQSYQPLSTISRAECAAIISRIAKKELRKLF